MHTFRRALCEAHKLKILVKAAIEVMLGHHVIEVEIKLAFTILQIVHLEKMASKLLIPVSFAE